MQLIKGLCKIQKMGAGLAEQLPNNLTANKWILSSFKRWAKCIQLCEGEVGLGTMEGWEGEGGEEIEMCINYYASLYMYKLLSN